MHEASFSDFCTYAELRIYGMEYEELKSYLIEKFEPWAYEQRDLYMPDARSLSDAERSRLMEYFEKGVLDRTRIVSLEEIPNPPFYAELEELGIPIPLDLTQAAGFCLIDYVIIRKELWLHPLAAISTVFHEMVHLVQWEVLGSRRLIELYTDALIRDGYSEVVFERQAYRLTDRFVRGGPPFSVRAVVEEEFKDAI